MAHWTLIYLLGYLPQTFLLLYASLGLVGVRVGACRLVLPAVSLGLVALLLRPYLPQGWYVPAYLVVLTAGLVLFRLASVLEAVAGAALGFILIAAGDLLVVTPVFYLLGVTYEDAMAARWLYLLLGALEGVFLVLAALLVRTRNLTLISISRWEKALSQRRASK